MIIQSDTLDGDPGSGPYQQQGDAGRFSALGSGNTPGMIEPMASLSSGGTGTGDINPGVMPDVPLPADLPPEPVGISAMADLFGVTHRTLHFYEEKNLLSSSRIGLMRVYFHRDIRRMALINACREIGMPVATIQDLLAELGETISQAEADALFNRALEARKRELVASQALMLRQIQQINRMIQRQSDDFDDAPTAAAAGIRLSDVEQTCLGLMAEGYSQTRIARVLDLPPAAVADLEAAIIARVGASNRFQAVAKAILLGLMAS